MRWYAPYRLGRIRSFMAASQITKRLEPPCFSNSTRVTRMPALPTSRRPGSMCTENPQPFRSGTISSANAAIEGASFSR